MLAFHFCQLKINPSLTMSQSLNDWKIMNKRQQLEYHHKSKEDWIPNFTTFANSKDSFCFLDKLKNFELLEYIRCMNLEPPSETPYLLYVKSPEMKHLVGPSDSISYKIWAKQQFFLLPLATQYEWFRRFLLDWREFQCSKLSDEVNEAIIKRVYCMSNDEREERVLVKPKDWPVISLPSNKCQFKDKPSSKYPLHPRHFYYDLYREICVSKQQLLAIYSSFNYQMKSALFEQVDEYRKEYGKVIKKYVDELPELERHDFLGDYRLEIYKLLSFDPFQMAYPVDAYPLYRKTKVKFTNNTEQFINSINKRDIANYSNSSDTRDWTKSDVLYSINQSMALLDKITNEMDS